jgi:parallel beta-helix repeat protein
MDKRGLAKAGISGVLIIIILLIIFSTNLSSAIETKLKTILIKDASHLNKQKVFVQNIYPELQSQDNIWKTIPEDQFIRVLFEKSLSSKNDITLYARSNSKNARVQVYSKDSEILITKSERITKNSSYKVSLKDFNGTESTFDLKITGGSIDFDYIVDPFIDNGSLTQRVYDCGIFNTSNAVYTLNTSISNVTTCINITRSNITLNCNNYTINYSSGGVLGYGISAIGVDNITVKNCRIIEGSATTNNKYALNFQNSSRGRIENNTINTTGNGAIGISLRIGSQNNTVYSNNIKTTNANAHGIYLTTRTNANNISFNRISTGGNPAYGIYLLTDSNRSEIYSNTVNTTNTNGIGIALSTRCVSNKIYSNNIWTGGSTAYGIYLTTNCNLNNITYNNISTLGTSSYGIHLTTNCNLNRILYNNMTCVGTTAYGVYLLTTSNANNVSYNKINTSVGTSSYGFFASTVNNNLITFNNILTYGATAWGVYLASSTNNTFKSNQVNTTGTSSYVLYGTTIAHYNNSIDTSNLAEGLPVNYTYNANNLAWNGINFANYGEVIVAWSKRTNITNSNFSKDGINLFYTDYTRIEGNKIYSNNGHGIFLYQKANNTIIKNNDINTSCMNCYGIYAYLDLRYSNITGNNITTTNTNAHAIYALNRVNRTNIGGNYINTTGAGAIGVYVSTNSWNTTIFGNNIRTNGTNSYGIYLYSIVPNTNVSGNNITTNGTGGSGIVLSTTVWNTTIFGNTINVLGSTAYGIYLTTTIRWTNILSNNITARGASSNGIYTNTNVNFTTINDNNITALNSGTALYLYTNTFYTWAYNNILSSVTGYGLILYTGVSHNIFNGTSIRTTGASAYGIYSRGAVTNNSLYDTEIMTTAATAYPIYLYDGAPNITFIDAIMNASTTSVTTLYIRAATNGGNLNFTNVSQLNTTGPTITWGAGANTTINTHWYYDALAVYTNATEIQGVRIFGNNYAGTSLFDVLTNSVGRIARQTILQYTQNRTAYLNYTPHTFNASFNDNEQNRSENLRMDYNEFSTFTFYGAGDDMLAPNVTLLDPSDGFNSSSSDVAFNASIADNLEILNVSLWANFSGVWQINQTNSSELNNIDYSFYVENIPDGQYRWAIQACDGLNCNLTANRTITIDTIYPGIINGTRTENNGVNFSRTWVYVNVSVNETNEANITFSLYNETSPVNITTFFTKVRFLNWTNLPNDIYYYNVTVADIVNHLNTTATRKITLDTQAPQWSNMIESPTDPATYVLGQSYQFNMTWTDNLIGIRSVKIQNNFTGAFVNYTAQNVSDEFYYNRTNIAAGVYQWQMIANDTIGNTNYSTMFTYTLNRAAPSINLTINGSNDNLTVEIGTQVNISAYRIVGEGVIALYKNGTLINRGNGPLQNLTNFTSLGVFNITLVYNITQNYSTSLVVYYITVNDTTYPNVTLRYPVDGFNSSAMSILFNASVTDNGNITNVSLWANFSGTWEINQTNSSQRNRVNYTFNVSNIPDGIYSWAIEACDGGNNCNLTASRTITIDRIPPTITLIYPENNTNVTSSSVNFTWNVTDILSPLYCNITINSTVNVSNILSDNGLFTNYTVIGLLDGNYTWNVTCRDILNRNTSATWRFTVYTVSSPQNFNTTLNPDNLSLDLRWGAVAKANYYNVYVTDDLAAGFSDTPDYTGITTPNFTDNTAGNVYRRFYKVSAVNGPAENLTGRIVGKIKPSQSMTSGFNLASIPLNLTGGFVLNNGVNNKYNPPTQPLNCILSIFRYNGTAFEETTNDNGVWTPAIGSPGFTSLEAQKGYWFETSQTCNVTFLGEVPTENSIVQINNTFYLASWHDPYDITIGEEAVYGNPFVVNPEDSIDNLFRYNTSKAASQPTGFQILHHFPGYGWWPVWGDEDFNQLESGVGYYLEIPNPQANWTQDPTFQNP